MVRPTGIPESALAGRRRSLPVVARHHSMIDPEKQNRLRTLADLLLRDEPALSSSHHFGPLVRQGAGGEPALIFGDQREISLYEQAQISPLEHRMALLAKSGDIVVVRKRDEAFEGYLAHYLNLEKIHFVEVENQSGPPFAPISVHCWTDRRIRSMLQGVTTNAGCLLVLPYFCTGNVWQLAQRLAECTDCRVQICGPPPKLCKRANDKIWFADRVRQIIGNHALPPTFAAYGPAAAAARVARLARQAERVVIKIPDSAGSMGNIVLDSLEIAHLSLAKLQQRLVSLLHGTGWKDCYPVLIGVWNCNVISSPSVQIWIPLPEQGPPLIEGIFEQRVSGTEGAFIGAVRAKLAEGIEERLVNEAAQLAFVFQHLGFFGRCSFDCIIAQSPRNGPQLHWIECNGRWGGVSIPMTLANRLAGNEDAGELVIVQQTDADLPERTTEQVIDVLKDMLFVRGFSKSGIVLLAPPSGPSAAGIYFMAIAPDYNEAERLAQEAINRLQA